LRGWRHGIRRAHKVTIDLAAEYRKERGHTMPPARIRQNLIVVKPTVGFTLPWAGASPLHPSEEKKRCGATRLLELLGEDRLVTLGGVSLDSKFINGGQVEKSEVP
jgi:hypothetical protein